MRLREALRSALASRDEVAADEERRVAALQVGATPVARLRSRRRATVTGVLRSVVLRPADRVQAVEAELFDGSGSVDLVWLGRRRIAGIEPGRRARAEGLVTDVKGRRVMFNPRYELLAGEVPDVD